MFNILRTTKLKSLFKAVAHIFQFVFNVVIEL